VRHARSRPARQCGTDCCWRGGQPPRAPAGGPVPSKSTKTRLAQTEQGSQQPSPAKLETGRRCNADQQLRFRAWKLSGKLGEQHGPRPHSSLQELEQIRVEGPAHPAREPVRAERLQNDALQFRADPTGSRGLNQPQAPGSRWPSRTGQSLLPSSVLGELENAPSRTLSKVDCRPPRTRSDSGRNEDAIGRAATENLV